MPDRNKNDSISTSPDQVSQGSGNTLFPSNEESSPGNNSSLGCGSVQQSRHAVLEEFDIESQTTLAEELRSETPLFQTINQDVARASLELAELGQPCSEQTLCDLILIVVYGLIVPTDAFLLVGIPLIFIKLVMAATKFDMAIVSLWEKIIPAEAGDPTCLALLFCCCRKKYEAGSCQVSRSRPPPISIYRCSGTALQG